MKIHPIIKKCSSGFLISLILLLGASWAQATSYTFTADSTKTFTVDVTSDSIEISGLVVSCDEALSFDKDSYYQYSLSSLGGLSLSYGGTPFPLGFQQNFSVDLGTYPGLVLGEDGGTWEGLNLTIAPLKDYPNFSAPFVDIDLDYNLTVNENGTITVGATIYNGNVETLIDGISSFLDPNALTESGTYKYQNMTATGSLTLDVSAVPEPAGLFLVGLGLISLAGLGRKKLA